MTNHPGDTRGEGGAVSVPAGGEAAMMLMTQPGCLRAPGVKHPGLLSVMGMAAVIIAVAGGAAVMHAMQIGPWKGLGADLKALLGLVARRQ